MTLQSTVSGTYIYFAPPSNWFFFFSFFFFKVLQECFLLKSNNRFNISREDRGGRKTGSVHSRHFPPVTQWETVSRLRPGECTCRSTWISSTQTVHRGCDSSSSSSSNMGGKIHPFSYSAHFLFRVNMLFIFYGLYYFLFFFDDVKGNHWNILLLFSPWDWGWMWRWLAVYRVSVMFNDSLIY